jgi:DNA-binding NtrC family response regulator
MKLSAPMTVLCVEDEDEQLILRKMIFEAAGFEFIGVRTGAEALALLQTRQIGAAVVDYWMSGMNGMALATEMKRQRPDIPVVMLSGFAALPGEGVGVVDAWLQKARVEPESLVEQVRGLINRNAANTAE